MRTLARDHHGRIAELAGVPDEIGEAQGRLAPETGVADGEDAGCHGVNVAVQIQSGSGLPFVSGANQIAAMPMR